MTPNMIITSSPTSASPTSTSLRTRLASIGVAATAYPFVTICVASSLSAMRVM